MYLLFSSKISRMGFFRCAKQAESNRLVVDLNFGHPLAVFLSSARKTALIFSGVLVMCVLRVRNFSQVIQSVVRAVSVDVVKLFRRPAAVSVEPCQPVRQMKPVVYANDGVAIAGHAASHISFPAFSPAYGPGKNARGRVVVEKFAETVYRKVGLHSLVNIIACRRTQA